MTHDDRQMINWFKAELRSYFNSQAMLKTLDQKIRELDNMLAYHSPSLTSDSHGTPTPMDEKLTKYITVRSRFMAQYESLECRQIVVESILGAIPKRQRGIIIRVIKGSTTMENEAVKSYRTKNEIQGLIDREILKAVKKFTTTGLVEYGTK